MIIWCDGDWLEGDAARVPVRDRGFALGDGLFETILWDCGLKRFDRHHARLTSSAAALRLPPPPEEGALADIARETIARNQLHNTRAALRVVWTAGAGPRGLPRPQDITPSLIISAAPSPELTEPVALKTVSIRRNETAPSSRHKTLSYIDSVMARAEAEAAGADEALMLNTRGNVASGAASNIFLVIDGRVRTPALEDGALPGTVRAALLDAALGDEVGAIAAEDAARAEAAFITNALNPLRAVKSIDGRVLDAEHAQISIMRQPARDAP
jgi:branched-subunit amino acid aminotransferase/4-amino-4-deoxychorismate lyase